MNIIFAIATVFGLVVGILSLTAVVDDWVQKRTRERKQQEEKNRKAPYKMDASIQASDPNDLFMWSDGSIMRRQDYEAVIHDAGHNTHIVVPVGSADYRMVLANLYQDSSSLETTENEAWR